MNKDFIVKNGLQVAANVAIGGEVSNVTAINFYAEHNNDQPSEGHLCWNSEDGTLNLGLTGGNVVLQTGQETLAYVKNTTANTILNGTAVAHTSAQDGRLIIQPFIADGTFLPEEFLGVATENIAPSSLGYVNTFGYVRDFDTSSFNVGDILYVSASTPGGLTSETPISPNVKVVVGSVVSSGASGSIFVDRVNTPLASDVTYNNATSNLVATNLQAAVDELQFSKASVDLLSSSITVYPTTAASNVANYFSMVTNTDDADYDDPAANVATGAITTDNQLIANVIADAGIFVGNPGAINITTIGNIAKTSGNQNQFAEFYFILYKRDESGTETAIGTSSTTGSVNPEALNQFSQFSATALLNTTAFTTTDRLVVKYYGNVTGNPGAEYEFQFGGVTPVRTLLPVPVSVIPSGAASSILVDTSTFNGVLSGADSTLQTALETLDDHSHSTDEVSEGSNLYYTLPRANAAIDARVTKTYVDALNVDADTLDNQNSSYYLDWTNTTNKPDPNIEVVLTGDVTGSANATLTDLSNGSLTITTTVADDSHNHTIANVDGLQTALDTKLDSSSYTASDVLSKLLTVDGSGSGLDADTLDSLNSTQFLRSDAADTKTSGDLGFSDNVKAAFGTGNDLQIYHDGSHSYIDDAGTGSLFIRATNLNLQSADGSDTYLTAAVNGAVGIRYDGSEKLVTNSTGISVTGDIAVSGTVDGRDVAADGTKLDGINQGVATSDSPTFAGLTTTANVSFGDNDKAVFGTGNDLQIYHDGSDSFVQDVGTGNLLLQGDASVRVRSSDGTLTSALFIPNGLARLNYAGGVKLETTTTGVGVTGDITVSGTVDGRDVAADGTKLDGIEAGATADQTASEILTAIKTVDGSGSGLDADTLDGQQGSYYLDWTNTTNKPDPTLTVNGDASGSATFTNLGNATLTLTIADDSHNHTIVNIDGLQTSLDSKANVSTVLTAGAGLTGGGSLATNRTFTIGAGAGITVNTSNVAVDTSVIATRAYVDSEVSNLVASAPETLDTLNELAAALGDDPNFATTVSTQIGTKANSSVTVNAGAGLTGGGDLTTNRTISHADTSSQASVNNSNGAVIQDVTLDTYGHVTSLTSANLDDRYYTETEADARFHRDVGDISSQDWNTYIDGNETGFAGVLNHTGANRPVGSYTYGTEVHWSNSGQAKFQLYAPETASENDTIYFRTGWNTSYRAWNKLFSDTYHPNADKLTTARNIALTGAVTGNANFDGSGNISISTTATSDPTLTINGDASGSATFTNLGNATLTLTIADDSHEHKRLANQSDPSVAPDYALEYLNLQGTTTDTPTTDWYNVIRMGHGDPNTYYNNTLAMKMTGAGTGGLWGRTRTGGTAGSWFRFFDDNYHPNADKLTTARNIALTGAVTGNANFDGSGNISIATTATADPTLTLTGDATGSATFTNLGNATLTVTIADDSHNHIISNVDGLQTALDAKLASTSYTAADVLTKVKTVDGSGSGLDADLLDGQQGSYYLDWTNTTNKPDPTLTLSGDASGSATFTNLGNATLTVTVADDSHNHSSSSGNFTVGGDLTVSGGQVTQAAVSTRDKYRVWSDGTYAIGMQTGFTFGGLTNDYAMTFQMSNTDGRGFWWGDASHTNAQGAMSLTTNGKLSVAHSARIGFGETDTTTPGSSYTLHVNGSFAATTKSFVIDHPTKEGMKLRHGSLEGPEDGVYVRGRLKDNNVIELPDYWTGLVHEDSITVNLTAIGKGQDLWVEDIVDNKVIVGGGENVNCFYTIYGTRKDVDRWDVEYEG